jgi:hypothetical protein
MCTKILVNILVGATLSPPSFHTGLKFTLSQATFTDITQRSFKVEAINILYTLDSASLLVKLKPRIGHVGHSGPLTNKRLKNNNNFHHLNSLKMYLE